jgi:multimeric flavodoxin WrbA
MNEIYPMWVRAHGIMIVCPVNWYQAPSPLKLMIDRLVCADGGNPDPTSTGGKDPERAKALELQGWPIRAGPTRATSPGAPLRWWSMPMRKVPKDSRTTCSAGLPAWD